MTERDSETRAQRRGGGEASSLSIKFELGKKSTNEIDFAYTGLVLFRHGIERCIANNHHPARELSQRRSIDGVRNWRRDAIGGANELKCD